MAVILRQIVVSTPFEQRFVTKAADVQKAIPIYFLPSSNSLEFLPLPFEETYLLPSVVW